jgi:lysophospholipase L1-like esterase
LSPEEGDEPRRPTRRTPLPLLKRLFFSAIMVTFVIGLAEVGLRVAGVEPLRAIGSLRFGYDTGIPRFDVDPLEQNRGDREIPLFEADPVLYWRPIPDTRYTDGHGFRWPGPSQREKPPGSYRVAVIGDSCSFLGKKLYVQWLTDHLEDHLQRSVDSVNASCPGYSSYQGRRRLADVWEWNPDLLVVYFGWNDHWKSLNGCTDAALAERVSVLDGLRGWLQQHSSVFALMKRMLSGPRRVAIAAQESSVRVPPEEYRENLDAILKDAASRQCQVLLVTAPTTFDNSSMPAWAPGFFHDCYDMTASEVAAIPAVHAQYNELVRQASRQFDHAVLADLAEKWDPEDAHDRSRRDASHLTELGHQMAAHEMFEAWKGDRGQSTGDGGQSTVDRGQGTEEGDRRQWQGQESIDRGGRQGPSTRGGGLIRQEE